MYSFLFNNLRFQIAATVFLLIIEIIYFIRPKLRLLSSRFFSLLMISVIIYLIFDYASLLSFCMVTTFTIYEAYVLGFLSGNGNIVVSCLLFAIFALMWFGHRQNIFRLLVGKENSLNVKDKLKKFKLKRMSKAQKEELKQKEIG